jgi:RHS repeat-associated protein
LPVEQVDGSGNVLYYLQDQLGSTRGLTDSSGNVAASFTYDPYGQLTSSTGTATTPFGYAGQYTDAESGLQYLRARYYDPSTMQFLTVDPLLDQTRAPHSYVYGDPLDAVDLTGMCGLFGICPPNPVPAISRGLSGVATFASGRR